MRQVTWALASIGATLALAATPAWAAPSPTPSPSQSATAVVAPRTSGLGGEQLNLPGRQLNAGPGATKLPKIWAKTWIIADATTGEVLAAKNAHVQRAPASTLKSLTALTLLPRLSPQTTTVATPKATHVDGTRVGLIAGKTYSVNDLMYGLMLHSGNDAAIALAQANGGVAKTVHEMNDVAAQLQAVDTVAKTPNGLDHAGQVSTAYDLALIARAGLQRPDFAQIVSTATFDFPITPKKSKLIVNQNRLITHDYRGAVGVKMGFTSQAGRTFVAAATRHDHTIIFVGMGIISRSDAAAKTALDWAFANLGKVTPVGTLVDPTSDAAVVGTPPPASSAPIAVDLTTAGLDVPAPEDPMAPWWFWTVLGVSVATAVVGLRVRKARRERQPAYGTSPGVRVDYRPYDPR